jgi:hypothetical protein
LRDIEFNFCRNSSILDSELSADSIACRIRVVFEVNSEARRQQTTTQTTLKQVMHRFVIRNNTDTVGFPL